MTTSTDERRPDVAFALRGILDRLNSMLEADPVAVRTLMLCSVACNQALAEHPTAQVNAHLDDRSPGAFIVGSHVPYTIRPVGFINGMLGITPEGWGPIVMVCEPCCRSCDAVKDVTIGEPCPDCGEIIEYGRLVEFAAAPGWLHDQRGDAP